MSLRTRGYRTVTLTIIAGAAGSRHAAPASMVVVLDWFEELKRRVAASQR